MSESSPITADFSLNTLFKNRLEFGISYRLEDAITGMFNVYVTPSIRIGYSYDYTTSELSNYSNGSHELFLLFDLDLLRLKKGYNKSPRFY